MCTMYYQNGVRRLPSLVEMDLIAVIVNFLFSISDCFRHWKGGTQLPLRSPFREL